MSERPEGAVSPDADQFFIEDPEDYQEEPSAEAGAEGLRHSTHLARSKRLSADKGSLDFAALQVPVRKFVLLSFVSFDAYCSRWLRKAIIMLQGPRRLSYIDKQMDFASVAEAVEKEGSQDGFPLLNTHIFPSWLYILIYFFTFIIASFAVSYLTIFSPLETVAQNNIIIYLAISIPTYLIAVDIMLLIDLPFYLPVIRRVNEIYKRQHPELS